MHLEHCKTPSVLGLGSVSPGILNPFKKIVNNLKHLLENDREVEKNLGCLRLVSLLANDVGPQGQVTATE